MEKKIYLISLVILIIGTLTTFVWLAIAIEKFSHWWWAGELIIIVLLGVIWVIRYALQTRQPKKEDPKKEPIKGSVLFYRDILAKYWKHPNAQDPDMLEVGDLNIPFPSKENETHRIINAKKVNLGTNLLVAIGISSKRVEDTMEGEDVEKFKEYLKPKLVSITESTDEDRVSGKTRKVRYTEPIVEPKSKEETEKEKEQGKIDRMETTKKEKK